MVCLLALPNDDKFQRGSFLCAFLIILHSCMIHFCVFKTQTHQQTSDKQKLAVSYAYYLKPILSLSTSIDLNVE